MNILVALEPRAYREAFGLAIQCLRPQFAVTAGAPDVLDLEIARFKPRLVISDKPPGPSGGGVPAWVELRLSDTLQVARVCIAGEREELRGVQLCDLLRVIDRTERFLFGTAVRPEAPRDGAPFAQETGPRC